MRLTRKFTRIFLGLCLCLSSMAFAQTVTGSVTGTVTDSTGLVIAGAKVTVVNNATGVTNTTNTNEAGIYYIQYLRIGSYKITFSAVGFGSQAVGPFALEIDQMAKIDAKLKVGSTSEVVTVTDSLAPIMNTEDATIASTITSNTIENIPINGQNFMSLTAFLPGSVNTEPAASTGALPSGRTSERYTSDDSVPSFNGNRQMTNNFILDGVEINETLNNTAAYNPNPDAMDQIKVVTANASAEFGNANGGHVLAVTKGGTNKFHGSANGYLENENLDANTWANKLNSVARNQYTQSLFNGTFGGPIKRDKLFFFINYEGMRYHTGGTSTANVAPKTWETGDFSDLLSVSGIQLYDSQNGFKKFDNNQLPTTIANPAAKFLLTHRTGATAYYPEANAKPIDGVEQGNYHGSYRQINRNDQGDVRIDWKVRENDSVYGRYTEGEGYDITAKPLLAINFPGSDDYPFKGGVISWAHIFTPAMVNEARAGFSRSVYDEGHTTDPTGAFGLSGNTMMGMTDIPDGGQAQPGFSAINFSDSGTTGSSLLGTSAWMLLLHETNYTYSDNLSWQRGHHMVKAGVQFIRYQQNFMYPGDSGAMGEFTYTGSFTGAAGSTGSTFADFYLDDASEAQVGAVKGYAGQRQWRDAVYVQDDWKFNSKLTFNLGVRWEFYQPIYEVNNKELNINTKSMTLAYAGKDGNSRALYDPTHTNFEPRFGFAYQFAPRFVVRGGYGITNYLEGTGTNLRLTQNYPFAYSYNNNAAVPTGVSGGTPIQVENGFGSTSGIPTTASTTFFAWDKHLKPSLTQQFNLTAEYEFSSDTSISAGYVGQLGQHLIVPVYSNQWKTIGDPTTAPYQNLVGVDGQKLGSGGAVKTTTSESIMNYNALQATFRHRAAHGLEYTVNYTYGKAMTDYAGFYGSLGVSGPANYQQNPYNPHGDYGPSFTDIRHSINGTGVYQLPFGRGKAYGANMNPVLDEIAGGWKVGTSGTFFTGLPVDVSDGWGPINANAILWAQHANQYRKLKIRNRSEQFWFGNPKTTGDPSAAPCSGPDDGVCAYGRELPTAYGNAHVDTERAPGYRQIDFSLFKAFTLPAGEKVEFRTDFFNALNITSMGNPSGVTAWGTFGLITDSRSPQRQIQFALKYSF